MKQDLDRALGAFTKVEELKLLLRGHTRHNLMRSRSPSIDVNGGWFSL